MTFGEQAKKKRLETKVKGHPMSQEHLANNVGCVRQTIIKMERGQEVHLSTAANVAKFLGMDIKLSDCQL